MVTGLHRVESFRRCRVNNTLATLALHYVTDQSAAGHRIAKLVLTVSLSKLVPQPLPANNVIRVRYIFWPYTILLPHLKERHCSAVWVVSLKLVSKLLCPLRFLLGQIYPLLAGDAHLLLRHLRVVWSWDFVRDIEEPLLLYSDGVDYAVILTLKFIYRLLSGLPFVKEPSPSSRSGLLPIS